MSIHINSSIEQKKNLLSQFIYYSDVAERPDLTESIFLENGTTLSHDSGYGPGGDFCCPASPTSVPAAKSTKTISGMFKKYFTIKILIAFLKVLKDLQDQEDNEQHQLIRVQQLYRLLNLL